MKISESEWAVLSVLWSGSRFSLGEITQALQPVNNWNKNTVYTYLTRMEQKGLVTIDRTHTQPYSAAVSREDCARQERNELLHKVYDGAAGNLIAAFLKETTISAQEKKHLQELLNDMEV